MANSINIRDIPYSSINARCMRLISKYAHKAHQHDGTVINIKAKNVLEVLSLHANTSKSSELHSLYSLLKLELRLHLEESLFIHMDSSCLMDGTQQSSRLAG